MKVHHTTEMDMHCTSCGRSFLMLWRDKEEKNGRSETQWGRGQCTECATKDNNGRPPLGLYDLNRIAERGISKDQYYKELGYE